MSFFLFFVIKRLCEMEHDYSVCGRWDGTEGLVSPVEWHRQSGHGFLQSHRQDLECFFVYTYRLESSLWWQQSTAGHSAQSVLVESYSPQSEHQRLVLQSVQFEKKNSLLSIEMILKSQLSIVLYTNLAFIQIYSFSFVRFKNMIIYLIRSLIDLKWFMSYLAEFFLYY